jgi:hypothetical protein
MPTNNRIHSLLGGCCDEVFEFIKQRESQHTDGLVPATDVNNGMGINFSAVPKMSKKASGQRGWLLATLARMLEDQGRIEIRKKGSRTVYRIARP